MTLKGALIGCGYISEIQLTAWSHNTDAEIIAVCDVNESAAQHRAQQFNVPNVFTDYVAMLDALQLDFVDIATRPDLHLEIATAAANRGVNVFCQKPLAPSIEVCQQIVDVCEQAGITLMILENFRHQAWFRQMKYLITDGALGDVYFAQFDVWSRYSLPEPTNSNQPYFKDMPQLVIYEMGIHLLDCMRFLLGEPQSIYAHTRQMSSQIAGEDIAVMMLDFGDKTCIVNCDWAGVPPEPRSTTVRWGQAIIKGTVGTLQLHHNGTMTLRTDDGEQSWAFDEDSRDTSFRAVQQHFIDSLKLGTEPETSGYDNLRTMQLVFGAYASAAEKRIVYMNR